MASLNSAGALPALPISAGFLLRMERPRPLSLFPESTRPQRKIGALCLVSTASQVPAGDLDEATLLVDLENVGPYGEIASAVTVDRIGSGRIRFGDDDLITTQLRPYLLKVAVPPQGAIGSPEWISLKVNEELIRPRLLFFLLTTARYAALASILSTGKQHPRISPQTLLSIEVPGLSLEEQDALLARLEPLLSQSSDLLNGLDDFRTAIDASFHRHFGLDPALLVAEPEDRSLSLTLSDVAGTRDARFSYRFHSPTVRRARDRLKQLPHSRLREALAEPAVLGDSVSPSDYQQGTGRYYLSMVAVKRWRLELEGLAEVAEDYYSGHSSKHVLPGDVLMARSGEGTIGKVAAVPPGVSGVCADFVIRMRPDVQRLNPTFLRYCLTSSYYQHLVFGEKKGLGNNTNIFPNQLHEFPMITVPLDQQEEICRELDGIMLTAEKHVRQAKELRAKIQSIMEETFIA